MTDDEWAFVAPCLTLMDEDPPQGEHPLREVFDGLRYTVRGGQAWRMMPNDLLPWAAAYQQTRRWIAAGVFEAMVHDLRALLRMAAGRHADPTAAVFDGRTAQSTPESGGRAGYDGAKQRKGSKAHIAVDTPGHLLALHVTSADEQDRAQVKRPAKDVQAATGGSVELAYVDPRVRRPRVHGRTTRGRSGEDRHRAVGGEAAGGETRVRAAAAAAVGRRGGASRGPPAPAASRETTSGSRRRSPGSTSSSSPA